MTNWNIADFPHCSSSTCFRMRFQPQEFGALEYDCHVISVRCGPALVWRSSTPLWFPARRSSASRRDRESHISSGRTDTRSRESSWGWGTGWVAPPSVGHGKRWSRSAGRRATWREWRERLGRWASIRWSYPVDGASSQHRHCNNGC